MGKSAFKKSDVSTLIKALAKLIEFAAEGMEHKERTRTVSALSNARRQL
jgi:hypothetical protein